MLPSLTFVLGGAASGKSLVAENIIYNSDLQLVYVATSRIFDDEMQTKINTHIARRDARWTTISVEKDIPEVLVKLTNNQAVLIDCVTMWLTNTILDGDDVDLAQSNFLRALTASSASLVVVSNEVGQGIVPDNALSRQFREAQGRLNIALAARADCVIHVVAGLSHVLKGPNQ